MEQESYTFHLTAYDVDRYMPQVARALERRSELLAQLKYANKKKLRGVPQSKGNFHGRNRRTTYIMSAVGIVLGAAALYLSFSLGWELFFLLIGAALLGGGIFGFYHAGRSNPYARDAVKLLKNKDSFLPEDNIRIVFNEYGMRSARSFIPYNEFQCWIETEDLFLFMYGPLVTLLQKTDLEDGELTDFRQLVIANIKLHAKVADKAA
ncbi:MAG TPA: YcxB family protein [Candidatus Scatomorpha stercoravium]|nr:YcxB family protein [Candidatus Scatomorpha stercoravium]